MSVEDISSIPVPPVSQDPSSGPVLPVAEAVPTAPAPAAPPAPVGEAVEEAQLPPTPIAAPPPTPTPEPAPVGPTTEELAAAQTPVEPDPPRTEDERLEPIPTGPVVLTNGQEVDVVPLRLRETMKLLKIVTTGAGQFLQPLMNNLDVENPAEFAQTLGALVLMSIPDAENEAVAFVQAMVFPHGAEDMTPEERVDAVRRLSVELYNPDLSDVITIVERVIRRESEDIRNLGKRISQAFKLAGKVGQLPQGVVAPS